MTSRIFYIFIVAILMNIFVNRLAIAQAISEGESRDQAMRETQELLRSRSQREAVNTKEANAVRTRVKQVIGGRQNEDELYNLAADIMGNMNGMSAEEMAVNLQKAQSNPGAFMKNLTPEQQKRIRDLASKIPMANQTKP